MQVNRPFVLSTLAIALALSMAGCGDKQESNDKATQVAVNVNGEEITVHQLNFELSKMGNLSPEQAKQATSQVLKSLVDQQLLIQKAIEDKVDREPQVLQSLESARRQILAQGEIQKVTADLAKPSDSEIADYYTKNPLLFSDRRIYRLQEISIKAAPDKIELVKEQLQQAKNLGDFSAWLKAQNIPAQAGQTTKSAEQLPLELLPRLNQMKDGEVVTVTQPAGLNLLIKAGSVAQPVSQEQAKPMIERYLVNSKKREKAESILKSLREKAKIEYQGEFAKMAQATTEAPAKPAAPVAKEAPVAPVGADDKAIENGMSGLK